MFIISHEIVDIIAEMKQSGLLIFQWRTCPATSYVAATFHPTIGQCAHQSLSNIATPKLGMIPTRNRGTTIGSHIAKYISKSIQAKTTFGFIRLLGRWKGWIAKLASSTTELWAPKQDISWLSKHLHTQHKEASPSLLHSPSVYAFPFNALQGVKRRITSPSWSLCVVPFHTRFIKLILPYSTPN